MRCREDEITEFAVGKLQKSHGCCCLAAKSRLTLKTSRTVTHQAAQSMVFPRQEYQSGLPFPSPGDPPNPGIKAISPALQAYSLPLSHLGSRNLTELTWNHVKSTTEKYRASSSFQLTSLVIGLLLPWKLPSFPPLLHACVCVCVLSCFEPSPNYRAWHIVNAQLIFK